MVFIETALAGVFVTDIEPREDRRGFFARTFCAREFRDHGIDFEIVQCNLSFNHRQGALRGLHYQLEPAAEKKFFRCARGAIHHVVVDLRPDSATYGKHVAVELTADGRRGLFVPELCATGYQALEPGSEVSYMVSEFYSPEHERGLRYDDPSLAIDWPLPVTEISEKDASWPLLAAAEATSR